MSRISESDDEDFPGQWALYEANARRALHGKRGHVAIRELRDALLALPEKRLIAGHLSRDGAVCALGALDIYRSTKQGFDPIESMGALQAELAAQFGTESNEEPTDWWCGDDEYEAGDLADYFGMTRPVAQSIVWENDNFYLSHSSSMSPREIDEHRYAGMLRWCNDILGE